MAVIDKYVIIWEVDRIKLAAAVNIMLIKRWQPFGGPGYSHDDISHFQALVQYK